MAVGGVAAAAREHGPRAPYVSAPLFRPGESDGSSTVRRLVEATAGYPARIPGDGNGPDPDAELRHRLRTGRRPADRRADVSPVRALHPALPPTRVGLGLVLQRGTG